MFLYVYICVFALLVYLNLCIWICVCVFLYSYLHICVFIFVFLYLCSRVSVYLYWYSHDKLIQYKNILIDSELLKGECLDQSWSCRKSLTEWNLATGGLRQQSSAKLSKKILDKRLLISPIHSDSICQAQLKQDNFSFWTVC